MKLPRASTFARPVTAVKTNTDATSIVCLSHINFNFHFDH